MFRVLGPLEVTFGDRKVRVGRNRQMTVLAVLLLKVNKSVSTRRLVDAIWDGEPPKTAVEQVQTCVWRLRRAFLAAGADDGIIETTASGYLLRVDEGQVDTCLVDRLVGEAEERAVMGDLSGAIVRYRESLALFRGPVLPEITGPAIRAVASGWEQRRVAILEEFFELSLAVGRGSELIAELTALVEEYPLRERLRSQLILALHGEGRQAEALAVYRAGRHIMVTELGLEPGQRLREAQLAVLAEQVDKAVPTAVLASGVVPPAQLPADTADFVGRAEVIVELAGVLRHDGVGGPRIGLLLGVCGVGKTALAVRVAHLVRDRFRAGHLYADLGGSTEKPAHVADVLGSWLLSLGVPEDEIQPGCRERAAQFRTAVGGRHLLVVLDDVADAGQVLKLLPGGPGPAVLITSRVSLPELPCARVVEVGPLSEPEAGELFDGLVGVRRAVAEPGARRAIIRATGGLPLAIRSIGARIAARPWVPLAHFSDRLRDPRLTLDELAYGGLDLRERMRRSVAVLPDAARDLWCRMSLVEVPDFPAWVAAAAADLPLGSTERLLDQLVDRRLMEIVGVDTMGTVRYRLSYVTGLYARELVHQQLSEAARRQVLWRVARHWRHLASHAHRALGGIGRLDPLPVGDTQDIATHRVVRMVTGDPGEWLRVERHGLQFASRYVRPGPAD